MRAGGLNNAQNRCGGLCLPKVSFHPLKQQMVWYSPFACTLTHREITVSYTHLDVYKRQKLKFVPEQDTDFIFCTVGEEEGFIGSAGVLLLFLALILRLLKMAERQPFAFGRIYGYCVASIFLFHVFINVGMVLGPVSYTHLDVYKRQSLTH